MTGWFSDIKQPGEDGPEGRWQPCLQLDGMCYSFDVWHESEAACDQFIRDEILTANRML